MAAVLNVLWNVAPYVWHARDLLSHGFLLATTVSLGRAVRYVLLGLAGMFFFLSLLNVVKNTKNEYDRQKSVIAAAKEKDEACVNLDPSLMYTPAIEHMCAEWHRVANMGVFDATLEAMTSGLHGPVEIAAAIWDQFQAKAGALSLLGFLAMALSQSLFSGPLRWLDGQYVQARAASLDEALGGKMKLM